MTREVNTGLVKGCREASGAELLSVVSCKKRFTLAESQAWIPETTIKSTFRADYYSLSFYVRFPKGNYYTFSYDKTI